MASQLTLTIRHEDGAYWATVAEFPGVFATGDDLDELRASLEEGIALYLAKPNEPAQKIVLADLTWDEPLHTEAHVSLQYA